MCVWLPRGGSTRDSVHIRRRRSQLVLYRGPGPLLKLTRDVFTAFRVQALTTPVKGALGASFTYYVFVRRVPREERRIDVTRVRVRPYHLNVQM